MFPDSHLFISCSYPFIPTSNPSWSSSSCLITRRADAYKIVNEFAPVILKYRKAKEVSYRCRVPVKDAVTWSTENTRATPRQSERLFRWMFRSEA
jgi:hypothetical protein